MKTLIMVLSYAKANDMLTRNWPWLLKADCDMFGIGRTDSPCKFPAQRLIGTHNIGTDSYVNGDNLPRLLIGAMRHFAESPALAEYNSVCLIEPDTIMVKPMPPRSDRTFAGCLAGGGSEGFHAPYYFHPVWRVDRPTAKLMVDYGERMLQAGLVERGFPDRWIGLMVHLYDIPYETFPEYSRQAIDNPEKVREAREAIIHGVVAIHGVKTFDMLNNITSGLVSL